MNGVLVSLGGFMARGIGRNSVECNDSGGAFQDDVIITKKIISYSIQFHKWSK
jgi:hypothetical protein